MASARLWFFILEFLQARSSRISDPSLVIKGFTSFILILSIQERISCFFR